MTVRTTSGNDVRSGCGGSVARPAERRGSVRPGGRRGGSPLPPVRPPVSGGTGGTGGAGRGSGECGPLPTLAVVRRRRLVALSLTLSAMLAVGLLLPLATSSPADAAGPGVTTLTVVRSGESLQDVARRAAPGADERDVAARIRDLNGLSSSSVGAGRPLVVPAG